MQELAIKRNLNEETRQGSVWVRMGREIEVFSLHITHHNEVIITDHSDYTRIYSIESLEFYNKRMANNE